MVVKNEERIIGHSLNSIRAIADEIIVVDTGSTDRTIEKARASGAQIIHHQWDGSLGRARNCYLRAARGDWILVLDGDETVAQSDLVKIKRLVRSQGVLGYHLLIRNYTGAHDLMWQWHPNDGSYPEEENFSRCYGWMKTQPLRLFKNVRNLAYIEGTSVHTSPIASLKKHTGRIENRDDVVIHHFQYLKGGARFLSRKQSMRLKGEINHTQQFPNEPHTYLNVAKTLFAKKRDEEALRYVALAVKLDDAFHEAYQLWGMIDIQNGRLGSAAKHLRRATSIKGDSADAWALLGIALGESGKLREGIHALKKAIHLNPQHVIGRNSLGVLYEDMGRYDQAQEHYEAAIKLHPGITTARKNLSRLIRTRQKRSASRSRGRV